MKNFYPPELAATYGLLALAQGAERRTEEIRAALPAIDKEARARVEKSSFPDEISTDHFDVENSGDEDDIQDWLYEGFLDPIEIGDGGIKLPPGGLPDPDLPAVNCRGISALYVAAMTEYGTLLQSTESLSEAVDSMSKVAHPVIQIFVALFKAALEAQQARLIALARQIAALRQMARENGCRLPLVLIPGVILRR